MNYYYLLGLMSLVFAEITASESEQSYAYSFMVDDVIDLETCVECGVRPQEIFPQPVIIKIEELQEPELRGANLLMNLIDVARAEKDTGSMVYNLRSAARAGNAPVISEPSPSLASRRVRPVIEYGDRIKRKIVKTKSPFLRKVFEMDCSKLNIKECLRYYAQASAKTQRPLCKDPNRAEYYRPAINNLRMVLKAGETPTAEEHALHNYYFRLKMRGKR